MPLMRGTHSATLINESKRHSCDVEDTSCFVILHHQHITVSRTDHEGQMREGG